MCYTEPLVSRASDSTARSSRCHRRKAGSTQATKPRAPGLVREIPGAEAARTRRGTPADLAELPRAHEHHKSVLELKAGDRIGKIITTEPSEFGREMRRDLKRGEQLYVYKRNGRACRRCGDEIVSRDIDGRNVWWCPSCQPS